VIGGGRGGDGGLKGEKKKSPGGKGPFQITRGAGDGQTCRG